MIGKVITPDALVLEDVALVRANGAVPLYAIFPAVEFPVQTNTMFPPGQFTVPSTHDC